MNRFFCFSFERKNINDRKEAVNLGIQSNVEAHSRCHKSFFKCLNKFEEQLLCASNIDTVIKNTLLFSYRHSTSFYIRFLELVPVRLKMFLLTLQTFPALLINVFEPLFFIPLVRLKIGHLNCETYIIDKSR